MASSWSNKLETRLSALADGASRESIQTLAKWIGFNRKHSKAFCTTLASHLADASNSAARQWLYIQIVHEVLLLEKDSPTKWERLGEMRIAMGESVVLPALQRSDKVGKEKVAPLVAEWAKHNVFGTTTLIGQMRTILSSESYQEHGEEAALKEEAVVPKGQSKKEAKQLTKEVTKPEVKDDVPKKIAEATKEEQTLEKVEAERIPSLSLKPSASNEEVTFDFEGSVRFTSILLVYSYASFFAHPSQ
jgi:Holliday junction resolvasome RuvABC DNA-binding subunit